MLDFFIVGVLGLEPRMTGPESVVLPLHHTPIWLQPLFLNCECKGTHFSLTHQTFPQLFSKKVCFDLRTRGKQAF